MGHLLNTVLGVTHCQVKGEEVTWKRLPIPLATMQLMGMPGVAAILQRYRDLLWGSQERLDNLHLIEPPEKEAAEFRNLCKYMATPYEPGRKLCALRLKASGAHQALVCKSSLLREREKWCSDAGLPTRSAAEEEASAEDDLVDDPLNLEGDENVEDFGEDDDDDDDDDDDGDYQEPTGAGKEEEDEEEDEGEASVPVIPDPPKTFPLSPAFKMKARYLRFENSHIAAELGYSSADPARPLTLTRVLQFPLRGLQHAGDSVMCNGSTISFVILTPSKELEQFKTKTELVNGRMAKTGVKGSGLGAYNSDAVRLDMLLEKQARLKVRPPCSKQTEYVDVGVDPGGVVLAFWAHLDKEGRPVKERYTFSAYERQSHHASRVCLRRAYNAPISMELADLAGYDALALSPAIFKRHVVSLARTLPAIMAERLKAKFAQLDYQHYRAKQQALCRLATSMLRGRAAAGTDGKPMRLGFGDGYYGQAGRTPSKALFRALQTMAGAGPRCWKGPKGPEAETRAQHVVLQVPETCTSKKCCWCKEVLQELIQPAHWEVQLKAALSQAASPADAIRRGQALYGRILRGIRRCINRGCPFYGQFLHRDGNAALGILQIVREIRQTGRIPLAYLSGAPALNPTLSTHLPKRIPASAEAPKRAPH